jgi:hypothetical protein
MSEQNKIAPDGWQLVPKVPTDEMLNAVRDWSVKKYGIGVGNDGAIGCYAAMLAAAPQPQETQAVADDVETDINKRWESGTDHHPKSVELFNAISKIDCDHCDDYFCWKSGGDGDNGETFMYQLDIYFERLDAAPQEPAQHPDDIAVDEFAAAMKAKMAEARAKGRSGWQDCAPADLSRMLREHIEKGDPRDVANFCMMLWQHEEPIGKEQEPAQADAQAVHFVRERVGGNWIECISAHDPRGYMDHRVFEFRTLYTRPADSAAERQAGYLEGLERAINFVEQEAKEALDLFGSDDDGAKELNALFERIRTLKSEVKKPAPVDEESLVSQMAEHGLLVTWADGHYFAYQPNHAGMDGCGRGATPVEAVKNAIRALKAGVQS